MNHCAGFAGHRRDFETIDKPHHGRAMKTHAVAREAARAIRTRLQHSCGIIETSPADLPIVSVQDAILTSARSREQVHPWVQVHGPGAWLFRIGMMKAHARKSTRATETLLEIFVGWRNAVDDRRHAWFYDVV